MKRRVLVVDDDAIMRDALKRVMEEYKDDVVVLTGEPSLPMVPTTRWLLPPMLDRSAFGLPLAIVEVVRDEDDGPSATWTPKVGAMFHGHGPGARFVPDGTGGGQLYFQVEETRRGFRCGLKTRSMRKKAHRGG